MLDPGTYTVLAPLPPESAGTLWISTVVRDLGVEKLALRGDYGARYVVYVTQYVKCVTRMQVQCLINGLDSASDR